MYCTNCGKKLQEGDKFCASCGTEVRAQESGTHEDVVFNPPFKIEAQRRTEEILKSTEENVQTPTKAESVDFAWNLEGFPSTQPRQTEEVDFNWGSVVEQRNGARRSVFDLEGRSPWDPANLRSEPEIPAFWTKARNEQAADKASVKAAEPVFEQAPESAEREVGAEGRAVVTDEASRFEGEAAFGSEGAFDGKDEDACNDEAKRKDEHLDFVINAILGEEIPEIEELSRQVESKEEPAMSIEDLERELFGLAREKEAEEKGQLADKKAAGISDADEPTIIAKSVSKPWADDTVQAFVPIVSEKSDSEGLGAEAAAADENRKAAADEAVILAAEPDGKDAEKGLETAQGLEAARACEDAKASAAAETAATAETTAAAKTVVTATTDKSSVLEALEIPSFCGKEKFYTYNQKVEAFQQLLEQEKKRLEELEAECLSAVKSTGAEPVVEKIQKEQPVAGRTELQVEVAFAPVTMALDLSLSDAAPQETEKKPDEANMKEAEKTSKAAECSDKNTKINTEATEPKEVDADQASPSKEKLRYSDIFPKGLVDDDGDSAAGGNKEVKKIDLFDDIEEDDEPKKHTFAKVVIAILAVLIIAELAVIGVKFVAPESKFAKMTDEYMAKAADFLMGLVDGEGEDEENNDLSSATDDEALYAQNLVEKAAADVKTIGEVSYDSELKFSLLKNYSFEEIADADPFVEADWYETGDETVTYGYVLYHTLIEHYDNWKTDNKDESLVGINKLEIGESKTGENGFYTICRISFAGADGKEVVKYQTVFQKISEKTMIINETKEDNL